MDEKAEYLTLMLVDLPNAATVNGSQGVPVTRKLMEQCTSLVSVVGKRYGGRLVRAAGSALMWSFDVADDGVQAACDVQGEVAGTAFRCNAAPIVRIALHAGDVIFRNDMLTGGAITTAARLATLAEPGQILATDEVCRQVSPKMVPRMTPFDDAGGAGQVNARVYQVAWHDKLVSIRTALDEQTVIAGHWGTMDARAADGPTSRGGGGGAGGGLDFSVAPKELRIARRGRADTPRRSRRRPASSGGEPSVQTVPLVLKRKLPRKDIVLKEVIQETCDPAACVDGALSPGRPGELTPEARSAQLCVIWQGDVKLVDMQNPTLNFGRDEKNDIALLSHTASRLHGYLEFRGGEFYIVDHSWNGTFVYDDEGAEHYVSNDEWRLGGSGAVCPGCPEEGTDCQTLLFWRAKSD